MLFLARRTQKEEEEEKDGTKVIIGNETIEEKSNILTQIFGRLSLK